MDKLKLTSSQSKTRMVESHANLFFDIVHDCCGRYLEGRRCATMSQACWWKVNDPKLTKLRFRCSALRISGTRQGSGIHVPFHGKQPTDTAEDKNTKRLRVLRADSMDALSGWKTCTAKTWDRTVRYYPWAITLKLSWLLSARPYPLGRHLGM